MSDATTQHEPGRSLKLSIREVAFYGLMVGLGEGYLGAYAIHLGASAPVLGILATIAPFVGILAQLPGANLLEGKPRRKPFYVGGAGLQAAVWLLLVITPALPSRTAIAVLLPAMAIYFAGVHFASPAWNSMMGDLVPFGMRGRFFGRRNRAMVIAQWLGIGLGGTTLFLARRGPGLTTGFALLFAAASLARFMSALLQTRMREPAYRPVPEVRFSLRDFLHTMPTSNFGRFVLFVTGLSFSVHLAGPYFILYMLRDLHFTYLELMVAEIALLLGHILMVGNWGPLCDRFGNRRVMKAGAAGIILIPILWTLDRHPAYICALQFFGGAVWSGFNLGIANFLLDAVSPPKRARCSAYFNLINGVGIAAGGLTGAAIVTHLPEEVFGFRFFSPLYAIMILSGLMRLLVIGVFLRRFREVRDVEPIGTLGLFFRATYLKSAADLGMDLLSGYLRGGMRTRGDDRRDSPS